MKSTDERMVAVKQRSKELKYNQKIRKNKLIVLSSLAACFAVIVFSALSMPNLMMQLKANERDNIGEVASMFSNGGASGYLLIAFLSFALGVSITILCVHIHRRNKEEASDD